MSKGILSVAQKLPGKVNGTLHIIRAHTVINGTFFRVRKSCLLYNGRVLTGAPTGRWTRKCHPFLPTQPGHGGMESVAAFSPGPQTRQALCQCYQHIQGTHHTQSDCLALKLFVHFWVTRSWERKQTSGLCSNTVGFVLRETSLWVPFACKISRSEKWEMLQISGPEWPVQSALWSLRHCLLLESMAGAEPPQAQFWSLI